MLGLERIQSGLRVLDVIASPDEASERQGAVSVSAIVIKEY